MRILFVLLSLVIFVSCASTPVKSQAIHHALVTDAALREATDNCAVHGGETRRAAERGQLDWWRRNSAWVLAADYGLLSLNWQKYRDKAEAQRAINGIALLENIQLEADLSVADWIGEPSTAKKCDQLFRNVEKGKYDLTDNKSYAQVLVQLNNEREDVSSDAATARSINSRYRKYGRSLFTVEKVLKEAACADPSIALLRNSWPLEVYDALCSGSDYVLVKCEWGRCEVKR